MSVQIPRRALPAHHLIRNGKEIYIDNSLLYVTYPSATSTFVTVAAAASPPQYLIFLGHPLSFIDSYASLVQNIMILGMKEDIFTTHDNVIPVIDDRSDILVAVACSNTTLF